MFIEYVGKSEKGEKISQSRIHLEIQEHVEKCRTEGHQNCGILAPWGHGKTGQILLRVLDFIGRDVNARIQYICNTDDNAVARVVSVKKYIESDHHYHMVYPHVTPEPGGDWGKHRITVQRDSKEKDVTLDAWGITSSGTGSRSDIQIFDDPVDMRNAILNPSMRQQVKDAFKNVWLSRLHPGGFRIYIATAWHEDDLTNEIIRNSEWKFLIMRISDDFKSIECKSAFKGEYTIPLWDEVWSEEVLRKQFKLVGARAFARGYQQKSFSDEERMFPSSDTIFREDIDASMVHPHWPRVVGVDPFGKQVVIFVLALSPTSFQRVPIEIIRGKFDPKTTVRTLIEVQNKHRPQLIVVENNAAQNAIIQWAEEVGGANMVIVPFTTGSQKADPVLGLPSIEVEFANGSWCVPMKGVAEDDAENPFNVWKRELRAYPVSESWDTVMAMWFAREGARFLGKFDEVKERNEEKTVTVEDLVEEFESVQIGDY